MEFFILDDNLNLVLNKAEILLVPEFAALWEPIRNRCERDPRGYNRLVAHNEFKYIKLMYDWDSPYKTFSEQDRKNTTIDETGLTPSELNDAKFLAACRKYQKMQETAQTRLLDSAYKAVDELTLFYNVVNLQERDDMNKYVMDSKKLVDSMIGLPKAMAGLEALELVVKKQKEANTQQYRGDVEPGAYDTRR